ncbi:NHL domain-containing protein [Nannocystis punicea]|uniref:Teneurin NHL domain-containing protein n=1 Tax=Nannocystis punicea TaxID=2995304 RepID=A0ABY7GYW4_9BACT|nr:hypothetical protein [Nannocystis poenicansa]WAS92161.1 hypothetical protein O0S08_38760 [Nannocystis poenicansa]
MSIKTTATLLSLAALGFAASSACDRGDERCLPGPGKICTFLGTGEAGLGDDGLDREDTQLYLPQDLTFAADGRPYVLDWNNHRIIAVEADDTVVQVVGTGELGDAPDGDALKTNLNHPTHLSNSPDGKLIISAWHNSKIIEYDTKAGTLTTICGNGMRSYGGDGGPAKDAILDLPVATAFDAAGNMYITDQANQRIRKVGVDKVIDTFVGNGMAGFSGDEGPAAGAQIKLPGGQSAPPAGRLAIDGAGNIYLADSGNNRIRKIDPEGVISTYAGNGDPTFGGDGGPALAASLSRPSDIDLDPDGNLYIADTDNSCVRKVDTKGVITTVAGQCGSPGYGGDGGRAAAALLDRPYGVEFEDGLLYIADTHNHRIRVVGLE